MWGTVSGASKKNIRHFREAERMGDLKITGGNITQNTKGSEEINHRREEDDANHK